MIFSVVSVNAVLFIDYYIVGKVDLNWAFDE